MCCHLATWFGNGDGGTASHNSFAIHFFVNSQFSPYQIRTRVDFPQRDKVQTCCTKGILPAWVYPNSGGMGIFRSSRVQEDFISFKRFAFENSCIEFDEVNLKPTYKILWGVPGF